MAELPPIDLNQIPAETPLPDEFTKLDPSLSGTGLKKYLTALEQKAPGSIADGKFSETEFISVQQTPAGHLLKVSYGNNFSRFVSGVADYIKADAVQSREITVLTSESVALRGDRIIEKMVQEITQNALRSSHKNNGVDLVVVVSDDQNRTLLIRSLEPLVKRLKASGINSARLGLLFYKYDEKDGNWYAGSRDYVSLMDQGKANDAAIRKNLEELGRYDVAKQGEEVGLTTAWAFKNELEDLDFSSINNTGDFRYVLKQGLQGKGARQLVFLLNPADQTLIEKHPEHTEQVKKTLQDKKIPIVETYSTDFFGGKPETIALIEQYRLEGNTGALAALKEDLAAKNDQFGKTWKEQLSADRALLQIAAEKARSPETRQEAAKIVRKMAEGFSYKGVIYSEADEIKLAMDAMRILVDCGDHEGARGIREKVNFFLTAR